MEILIKIIPPLVLGSMLFFSIVIAPKIFAVLPNNEAGKFVRSIFPAYYKYNGLQYLILIALIFISGKIDNTFYLSCFILFLFLFSNYFLVPVINNSRDKDNQKLFKLLHLASVIINFLIIILSIILILLMY